MGRQQITTLLTVVIVAFWIVSAVIRIWVPFPPGAVLDSAMPLVIGFWFVSTSSSTKNGAAA